MIPDRTWRIAAALAAATNLDWGRWARGETEPRSGWPSNTCKQGEACGGCPECRFPRVAPSSWAAAADEYRADCKRRGVEPGPMPALSFCGDREAWHVEDGYVTIDVDEAWATIAADGKTCDIGKGRRLFTIADLRRLAELATVVEIDGLVIDRLDREGKDTDAPKQPNAFYVLRGDGELWPWWCLPFPADEDAELVLTDEACEIAVNADAESARRLHEAIMSRALPEIEARIRAKVAAELREMARDAYTHTGEAALKSAADTIEGDLPW